MNEMLNIFYRHYKFFSFGLYLVIGLILATNPFSVQAFTVSPPAQVPVIPYEAPGDAVSNLIGSVIQILVIISAFGVLIMLVWGALEWIIAGGDKDKISAARKRITNAIIGLVILALAGFIAALVGEIVGINPFGPLPIPRLGQRV